MKLSPVELVHVSLELAGQTWPVGRLALAQGQIWFEYHQEFIATGLEISPFRLPLKAGVVSGVKSPFDGLFGVFNDSLPDGWGRLLLDRAVRTHGIQYQSLTPLDRLTYVAAGGMGALTYQPDYTDHPLPDDQLNLDEIVKDATAVLEGEVVGVLEELYALGGSSAGARPKVMVGFNAKTKSIIHGQQALPSGYEHWLVKFASSSDPDDIANIEYAYSLMAQAAGVKMPETKLFPACKQVQGYFGAKRFDRKGNERIHMHTACGLLHADHRLPSLDYESLMRATMALCRNIQEVEAMYRLAVFNVFAHNRDDHSKNFSFLMDETGAWQLAPAYDLTFSYGPGGEHSTMVMGEGKNPRSENLRKLAKKFDVTDGDTIIEQVKTVVSDWQRYAEIAGVSKQSMDMIQKDLVETLRR